MSWGYLEIERFKNADLHTGYLCYNCSYFIKPNHRAIVEDSGPDVYEKESGIISPYGLHIMGSWCAGDSLIQIRNTSSSG